MLKKSASGLPLANRCVARTDNRLKVNDTLIAFPAQICRQSPVSAFFNTIEAFLALLGPDDGPALPEPLGLRLLGVLEADGALFLRYSRPAR